MLFNKRCCGREPMMNYGMQQNPCCDPCQNQPIVEPCITKCVEREFCHQVPHVCPIHTHVINRHVYQHTYAPEYSCSEENQVVNIDNGKCSGF